jgi:signal transduction histidine kinase
MGVALRDHLERKHDMPDNAATDAATREQTDASLRAEREQTDRALAERQQAVEDDADDIIVVARENADAVVDAAREKADEQSGDARDPLATRAAIIEERIADDATLQNERDVADEHLRREREDTARTLRALIPLEREKTDRHLLTERAIWDGAVANRDDFLGIVSHDLRGLLGGIVSAAALLSMKAPDTPTADMPPRRRSGSGGMPLP